MLVTVIAEKNQCDLRKTIQKVIQSTDAIELRLDYLDQLDIADIGQLRSDFSVPMIVTLRKKSQGGLCDQSEALRLNMLEKLAQLEPEFIDLEYDVPVEFAQTIKQRHPKIHLIRSYHDFEKTPDNLRDILDTLRHSSFSIYKVVTFAQSTLDCLKVLSFVEDVQQNTRITSFCMGALGVSSRVLGPIVGNALHYCCADEDGPVAPGQLSLSTMLEVYRLRSLNSKTHIYALLGNPVDKSVGHIVHNRAFDALGQNAVYVKLHLQATELAAFFTCISSLPFKGFSVTMPFKQRVMTYLDQLEPMAQAMDSVNTIVIEDGNLIGYNTDAKGALDAIEDSVSVTNKTVLIIGAGGAGRAIGHEAMKRGAKLIFVNRTAKKVKALAKEFHCLGYGMEDIKAYLLGSVDHSDAFVPRLLEMNGQQTLDYDILVNTTPCGMSGQSEELPIPEACLLPNRVVMDTVYNPIHTPLLLKAQALDCTVVYGYEMFINQAVQQLQLWMGSERHLKQLQQVCREAFAIAEIK